MEKTIKDICRGCDVASAGKNDYKEVSKLCTRVRRGTEEGCPCIECLLKPICNEGCEKV